MKNLLIYTGPHKQFDEEAAVLAKIQIDNSLDLGWKSNDIVLVTDFHFEYNGVKSLVVSDGLYYDFDKNANKAKVIVHLLEKGIIKNSELYWSHDLDAFQNFFFDETELELEKFDLGLTHYTYKPEWQFGSLFFRNTAKDIFEILDKTILLKPHLSRNNEKTLTKLIQNKAIDKKRFKRMNVTYNVMKKYLQTIYAEAIKPVRVLHFRPVHHDYQPPHDVLDIFMYGKNRLKMPLMSDRLIKIFHTHGIK